MVLTEVKLMKYLPRKERFGIGNKSTKFDTEKYGRGKRRRGQIVDYRKLNEGDEGDEQTEFTPASPKRTKHPPVSKWTYTS